MAKLYTFLELHMYSMENKPFKPLIPASKMAFASFFRGSILSWTKIRVIRSGTRDTPCFLLFLVQKAFLN